MVDVFLDTNVFFRENFLRSTFAEAVLKGAKLLNIKILIPEIVLDEAKRNFELQLKEKFRKFKESHKDLGDFMKLAELEINLDNAIDEYNNFLSCLLNEHGVKILEYPKIPIKTIVEASYEAKKPFNAKGEGCKDYVIWQTIKEHCEAYPAVEKRFFITADKDFCEKQDDETSILSPFLASSLGNIRGIPKVISSLKDFFDLELKIHLKIVNPANIPNLDTEKIVDNILREKLIGYSAYGFSELPFGNGVHIVDVPETPEITEIKISEVTDGYMLINASGHIQLDVHGFMDRRDYDYGDFDYGEVCIEDADWNEYTIMVSQYITTPFDLIISYSKADKGIQGYTIKFPNQLYHQNW